jgi:hypothetical protein
MAATTTQDGISTSAPNSIDNPCRTLFPLASARPLQHKAGIPKRSSKKPDGVLIRTSPPSASSSSGRSLGGSRTECHVLTPCGKAFPHKEDHPVIAYFWLAEAEGFPFRMCTVGVDWQSLTNHCAVANFCTPAHRRSCKTWPALQIWLLSRRTLCLPVCTPAPLVKSTATVVDLVGGSWGPQATYPRTQIPDEPIKRPRPWHSV